MSEMGLFPFGQPVLLVEPTGAGPCRCVVLGAYPSAVHVAWRPPVGWRTVRALPVDNEPEPFWNGVDQADRMGRWLATVGFDADRWGAIEPAGQLNGSSGRWVDERLLAPLGVARDQVRLLDCLQTYRRSVRVHARVQDTYNPFAATVGLPRARLARHPTEHDIVTEATEAGCLRVLDALLREARPEVLITLGRAALRVLRRLVEVTAGEPELRVSPRSDGRGDGSYGRSVQVRLAGSAVVWLPLAHPASPPAYQSAHLRWMRRAPTIPGLR